MNGYDHTKIEKKWQRVWKETGLYKTKEPKSTPLNPPSKDGGGESSSGQKLKVNSQKSYVLDMFPYPSGDGLHVGHPKGYIATDVYSRHKKMQGHSILHPMGWDAFGLPAENYAIKNKVHPAIAVRKNIKRFKSQLERIGFNYDWEREINTTDPDYYKWTQWIFLQMFKAGLAFQSHEPINWCPSCQTGLANEDLEDGKCERCGSVVEKKAIPQWVLRITKYADRLLSGLDALNWPEYIKESQRNWIGRSEGAEIGFKIYDLRFKKEEKKEDVAEVKVFTTRADTLFGATYLVLAPEHPLVAQFLSSSRMRGSSLDSPAPLPEGSSRRVRGGSTGNDSKIENADEVAEYLGKTKGKTEIERTTEGKEKTGVELKGIKAINPANQEEIPIWIADYVLADYGTGAIMAVPAHDERDFQFAKKFNLPVQCVIRPMLTADTPEELEERRESVLEGKECYVQNGDLINSGKFDGVNWIDAKSKIVKFVDGKVVTKYKLRDWVFSRQRYWGEPIPLIHCPKCGVVPVPEKELPVKLPNVKSYAPAGWFVLVLPSLS
ncbi:MAG: Leucine-tRNA ligase [Parcubacteria group bacterium GW2011_GWA2_49_9]|nr:MAG: Leucine-tRNA ligase [Parcubacteria group bacterium GW2011_GWA2_49_9]